MLYVDDWIVLAISMFVARVLLSLSNLWVDHVSLDGVGFAKTLVGYVYYVVLAGDH